VSDARTPSLAVVIPMFNEAAGAAACVRAVSAVLETLPVRCRLIVVNDGSADATAAELATAAASHPGVEVVAHAVNRGYGAALRTGVEMAARQGLDYVLFMDSDLTNSPTDIPLFVEAIATGADVVKATRYRSGGAMRGVPWTRQVISRTGAFVARLLFHAGISDCTNGFRAVRTSLLLRLRLREQRFPVIVEELYCCIFVADRFAEVPVVLTNRAEGLRRTSFAYRPSVFWRYLKYALLACFRIRPGSRIAERTPR
jgi:dolichol-phosphate mannosyltransferase